MSLEKRILELKQSASAMIGLNPLLNAFDQDYCSWIDLLASSDAFVLDKQKAILKLVSNIDVDYDIKLKSAIDEYSEVINYLLLDEALKSINASIQRVKECDIKQPDFQIDYKNKTYFLEMKTLGYTGGNLNYKQALNAGLDSQISLENQIQNGKKVAMSTIEIAPLYKDKDYDPRSPKFVITELNKKITNVVKAGQFQEGLTILLIDLNLINLITDALQESLPIYQEDLGPSFVSGILWNVVFGKSNDNIFKPIDFEGSINIEGMLDVAGILNNSEYSALDAVCFRVYGLDKKNNKLISLYRSGIDDNYKELLLGMSDYSNDENNSMGFEAINHYQEIMHKE